MKKLNKKGFTLIELLAVITIMSILMLVAIPAVARTIENTRRDTFVNTAKSYINAIKNAVAADELYVGSSPISAVGQGYYCYGFDTTQDSAKDLMEQGGKSSWGSAHVKGYVVAYKSVTTGAQGRTKYEYAIFMVDSGNRGINQLTGETSLRRSSVATSGTVAYKDAPDGNDEDVWAGSSDTSKLTTGTVGTGQKKCSVLSIK